MSYIYPSDLFDVRVKVRKYGRDANASRELIASAERIAVQTMCKGISQNQALTNARAHLWSHTSHGGRAA
ncbi:hypothetical protein SAMN04487785_11426 [Dyella jiangningensis]|uniref:hypothetical protein n=1 Tax=Dyella sp. AtDHG13 TaxID=1938897 RepID=UPI00088ABF8E|nr:hypothetical protein [Dyella sp. AtDHG13]PXV54194.1 hypothetical protein BDW41_113147 [Dyella sp. AtDHG13]SDL04544.1 hypothetical protein SAMN04487785_11426 [Dyella jiangningensis]